MAIEEYGNEFALAPIEKILIYMLFLDIFKYISPKFVVYTYEQGVFI